MVVVLEGRVMNAKAKHEILPFEIGKFYEDPFTGFRVKILCEVETTSFGKTLIAETNVDSCVIIAIKNDKETWARFKEIKEETWLSGFTAVKYN